MKFWISTAGLWALLLCGCSVTALAERERSISVNRCESSRDCSGGLVCVESQCLATSGQLSDLLIEVSPTVSKLSGEQLFKMVSGIPHDESRYRLVLGGVTQVTGSVLGNVPSECVFMQPDVQADLRPAQDGSIPARVTFAPSERTFGLAAGSITSQVDIFANGSTGVPPATYRFIAQLPAGAYDIYIEPYPVTDKRTDAAPDIVCSAPPELIQGVVVEDGNTKLELKLPPPARLSLEVRWPAGVDKLDGWTVDMIEPFSGRVVSTQATLKAPTLDEDTLRYSVELDYSQTATNPLTTVDEIVRLAPPSSVDAPTVLFQRSALELFAKGSAVIDQLTTLPHAVAVEGQVIDQAQSSPQRANITLIATELYGVPAGVLASFVRSVQSGEDGIFKVDLLPGTYRALTVPIAGSSSNEAPLASLETTIAVAVGQSHQAGRTIQLARATAIDGRVLALDGEGARGAVVSVEVTPSSVMNDVFARSLDAQPLVPRTFGTVIDNASGAFRLFADPGVFDFSVRPPEGSGLAWLVRPALDLTHGATESFDPLHLPGPVPLNLDLVLPSGDESLLNGAHVRAYALLGEPGKLATSPESAVGAVPVAEGRVTEGGSVRLLLPAGLEGVDLP